MVPICRGLDFLSNIEKYCPIIADTTDIVAPYNDKAQPPFKYIQTFFSNHLQIIYLVSVGLDFLSNIEKYCPIIADTTDIVAPYNDKAQPPFLVYSDFFFKSFANHLFSKGN